MKILRLVPFLFLFGCESQPRVPLKFNVGDEVTIKLTSEKGQIIQPWDWNRTYDVRYVSNMGVIDTITLKEYELESR